MIVVDTNIISYLHLPTPYTEQAEELLQKAPEWAAPLLWQSEFRNVLALYLRKQLIQFDQSLQIFNSAASILKDNQYTVAAGDVMRLVEESQCSAYDCEYVALAKRLNTKLVTQDKKVLREFPAVAISLATALA